MKFVGDKEEYSNPLNPKEKVCYGCVVVKSLVWPGSYSFYHMGRNLSIYMGDG